MRRSVLGAALAFFLAGSSSAGEMPAWLNNSYVGLGAGYTSFPYSGADLINGFTATRFQNPSFGANVYAGHYFSRHLGAEVGLMRPIQWAHAYGIQGPSDRRSIWVSLFDAALRPTWPITERLDLYGLVGLGIVSRHGFAVNGVDAVSSADLLTFFTGGGLGWALTPRLHWNAGIEYAGARESRGQPRTFYAYSGLYWLFRDQPRLGAADSEREGGFLFPKSLIQAGGFSDGVVQANPTKYVTVGHLPIFFGAEVKAKDGVWLMVDRNIFHTAKRVSIDLGFSAANYHTALSGEAVQAFSVYPTLKLWFWRSGPADLYFRYSLAGPAYLTKRSLDGEDLGSHFSFQDLMGLGAMLGSSKRLNVSLNLAHYSNGNLFPNNPGIEVPLVLSAGWSF